ncbi:MAG: hypothetical protein ACK5HY_06365, partial [Parahaliea sp.]
FWRMDKSREHPAFAWIMQVAPRLCSSCCTKNVHAFALAPTLTLIKSENPRKSPATGRREKRRTV